MATQAGVADPGSFSEQFGWVPTSANLAVSLARAQAQAGAQSHRFVTLEHLLFALSDDADAVLVLRSCNIDADRLRQDMATYLGQLQDRVGANETAPQAAHEDLLKILRTAAEAARQVRRSKIDGAIVLAALVGEGQSPAAEFLKSYGLTFEAAIRSLQARGNEPEASEPAAQPVGDKKTKRDDTDARSKPVGSAKKVASSPPPSPSTTEEVAEQPVTAQPAPQPHAPASQPTTPPTPKVRKPRTDGQAAPAKRQAKTERAPPVADSPQVKPATEAAPTPVAPTPVNPPPVDHRPPPSHTQAENLPSQQPKPAPPAATVPPPPKPAPASLKLPTGRAPAQQEPTPPSTARSAITATIEPLPVPFEPASPDPVAIPPWPETSARPIPLPQPPVPRPDLDPHAGGIAGPPFPSPDSIVSPHPPEPQPRRAYKPGSTEAAATDSGRLVENIPRRMRVAVPCKVEVRVARNGQDMAADAMAGIVHQHALSVTKAMAVRLRAPDGGFHIEPGSPETQWITFSGDLHGAEFAAWHWRVTPQKRGRMRLRLVVSSRTIATDGLTAESTLPDRIVDIRVRANYGILARRWGIWLAVMIGGGILGRFGEGAFDITSKLLQRLGGGQ